MDKEILEEVLKAVPCAARLGFLCDTPHKHWASCCRLMMAIKKYRQMEEEDRQFYIDLLT